MHQGNASRRTSCPQESASLTSAHSLAHQLMRSTERCSTGPAPKEFTSRQAGADTLSHNSMLSRPFVSASLTSLTTVQLSSCSSQFSHPAAMQDGCSLPCCYPLSPMYISCAQLVQ
ncbi:hypothetical protein B9Z55_010413 [Caenorhabditis nigoni]|uniref:Uncharacterized protein n=1 Tax=Caenorhabditis nigoni TaxID=1611254 RepID=A0A2G5UFQ4_9PELO|nr:hypothetical protein B9Z55_010413 [Caenorhabditis nigoni]